MLSESASRILDDLPPYLGGDANVQTMVQVEANEFDLIADTADEIRMGLFPTRATDDYGMLGLWEKLLGLPVEPANVTVERRRGAVLANLRSRNAGSGLEWEKRISEVLGTSDWRYREFNIDNGDEPYTIYIFIPYSPTGYTVEQVARLARRVTPAHLDLVVTYESAFIVGESLVDHVDASEIGEDVL